MGHEKPTTTVPPTLPPRAGLPQSLGATPTITPMQGVAGCVMTCLAALLIGGTALLALLFMAPLSNGGHHGDPVGLVPLLVVWPVVAVVLPFAGWLVRLPWHVSLAPLGVGMLVALTPPLLSAVAVATDGNGVQWALLGILLVPVGLGVWLVRAGIAHLRASEQ